MSSGLKPCSRKNDILTQEIVGETMIYDLIANKAYLLNPTSSIIWQLSDGTRSISEIARLVGQEIDSPVPEDLVWLALDQLKNENLLESKDLENTNILGLSRREVIRKVGLSSMVALPLISSIVVPFSVQGQSCFPNTVMCATPSDCCSGCCYFESSFGPTCDANSDPTSCI